MNQFDKILSVAGEVGLLVYKASQKDFPGALDAATAVATSLNLPQVVKVIGEIKSVLPLFAGPLPPLPAPSTPTPATGS